MVPSSIAYGCPIQALLATLFISFVGCWLPQSGFADEDVLLLDDFEGAKLSQRWTAIGKIGVQRVDAPDDVSVAGVAGMMAACDARPQSKFLVNRKFQRPPYQDFDTIRFRMRVENASVDKPQSFEFQVFSQERTAALWRKFVVETDKWQVIELPMQHFRYSNGASVDWTEISRFGIHFRGKASVSVDGFELVAHQPNADPYFTPTEIGEFTFGHDLIHVDSKHFAVLTDDDRVDTKATLNECEKLFDLVYADFPDLPKPPRKIPILVFARKQDYENYWSKLGVLYASQVARVRSNGFSTLGIAGTYYSEEYLPVRPVLIHEACHALLAEPLGLDNGSEWLHEGLASYYQLPWTKQDIHELNRKAINRGQQKPLAELLDGSRLDLRDYGQVTLFVKWLIEDEQRKKNFVLAMQGMRSRSSTRLEPICKEYFEKRLDELELDWIRWAQMGE